MYLWRFCPGDGAATQNRRTGSFARTRMSLASTSLFCARLSVSERSANQETISLFAKHIKWASQPRESSVS